MSRLTIDMTDQQHQSLKALAALQGKTIKQYALERLFPGDADADQAWQELKTMLGMPSKHLPPSISTSEPTIRRWNRQRICQVFCTT